MQRMFWDQSENYTAEQYDLSENDVLSTSQTNNSDDSDEETEQRYLMISFLEIKSDMQLIK